MSVGAVGLEAHCILDTTDERRSPSSPFDALSLFIAAGQRQREFSSPRMAKPGVGSHDLPPTFCTITESL